jgi:hypothetical protein
MLNLDETLEITSSYVVQRDLYLKGLVYSFGVIVFIDIVRGQVAEINLLQLMPGFYLILLFLSFLFLLFFSDLFFSVPFDNDNKKSLGTKTIQKLEKGVTMKFSFFLFVTGFLVVLNTVIPLSLDSFNSYGEKTLENIWSFDEVISLEIILLVILILLSQSPLVIVSSFTTENDVNILPEFWKSVSLLIFLAAGFLTPTIDGYTQLSFAGSAVSLYLFIINVLEKRVMIKFNGTVTLGS